MPLVMFCEVRGYPLPWVAWIWNGQMLQNNTNGPTYLLRRRATAEEAGIYTCKAGNMAGVTSFDYQLTVRGTYFNLEPKCLKIKVSFNIFLFVTDCFLMLTLSQ